MPNNKTKYNTEPEIALRQALRDHWKKKYGRVCLAADFLGVSSALLYAIASGRKWPNAAMLADAGIEATITRNVSWRKK